MTNEKLLELEKELLERMEVAKFDSIDLEINPLDYEFAFVHVGDKEYVNPKYISFADQLKIVQLIKFVKAHENLKEEDLLKILWKGKMQFGFLIDVCETIPNIMQEINSHKDEKHIAYLYFGLKNTTGKENLIQK